MRCSGRAWKRVLGVGLLLSLSSGAWAQALSRPSPIQESRPLESRPPERRPPHGPRPPAPPPTLTFQQVRDLVQQAARIVPELRAGDPRWRPQPGARPGAQRPAVPLTYQGAVVAFAFLTPQGRLADLASAAPGTLNPGTLNPGTQNPGTQNPDTRLLVAPDLPAQLAQLNVSGLVRLTGPNARLSLILDGRAVAELTFDRQGRLLPVPAGKPAPGGKKDPGKKGP
jgi:hypothetical protein